MQKIEKRSKFIKQVYKNATCFIISATPDEEIGIISKERGLTKYFLEVLGSSRSKTENIKYLLEKYALKPNICLFFGDAESDYKAANACGIPLIGILPSSDAPLLEVDPKIRWARDFVGLVV